MIVLPPTQAAPIPTDQFHLRVGLRSEQCGQSIPQPLQDMLQNGLTLPFTEVVSHGTIFFQCGKVRRRTGESEGDALRRKTWDVLEDWSPRVESVPAGSPRLVVDAPTQGAGESTKQLSELLGEALTISVATRVTGVPFKSWHKRSFKKGVRHDFDATDAQGRVFAEARGRYNGNNWGQAVKGIQAKFDGLGCRREYSRMVGVVYNLRASPDDDQVPFGSDLVVVDPASDVPEPPRVEQWRSLLLHYLTVFEFQGLAVVAGWIRALLLLPDPELEATVLDRRGRRSPPRQRTPSTWGRTSIQVGETVYLGTMFREDALRLVPGAVSRMHDPAPVFYGLARDVAVALAALDLDAIANMRAEPWGGSREGYAYSAMDDGSIFAMGSSDSSVIDHP